MKALGISGSPRKSGITTALMLEALDECAKNGYQTEHLDTTSLGIKPCNGCESCHKTGSCKHNDIMKEILEKLLQSDMVIVASPVYFYGLSGQLKIFIDRCQPLWAQKFILNKPQPEIRPCLFISAAGGESKDRLFIPSEIVINVFCNSCSLELSDKFFITNTDSITEADINSARNDVRNKASALLKSKRNVNG